MAERLATKPRSIGAEVGVVREEGAPSGGVVAVVVAAGIRCIHKERWPPGAVGVAGVVVGGGLSSADTPRCNDAAQRLMVVVELEGGAGLWATSSTCTVTGAKSRWTLTGRTVRGTTASVESKPRMYVRRARCSRSTAAVWY